MEIHVYIEVDDLELALAFYIDGLGLHERRRLRPHWVELAGAQAPIHLLARPEPDKDVSGTRPRSTSTSPSMTSTRQSSGRSPSVRRTSAPTTTRACGGWPRSRIRPATAST